MNTDIIVPIAIIASVFGSIYVYLSSRHRERLALIAKGMDASKLENKGKRVAQTLRMGMLMIGVAIGILVGHLLTTAYGNEKNPVFYFSMVFLFGGLSLIANSFVEKKSLGIGE